MKLNGTNVGETQMASVPGALYSKNSGSIMVYGSGTSNADKMIIKHSPEWENYGIGYNDTDDAIEFIGNGVKNTTVDLDTGDMSTKGSVKVEKTYFTVIKYCLRQLYANCIR